MHPLEAARYTAERSWKQYDTADPANRLVVPSIYSSAGPMGRKSALRREIPWILRGIPRASKLLTAPLDVTRSILTTTIKEMLG